MGLLSWFFPSPADRILKARKLLDAGRFADARLEVLDLDAPEAAEILTASETALCEMNLDAAVSWADADDPDRVRHHLEIADNFVQPHLADRFRETRRQIREIREVRAEEARAKVDSRLQVNDPLDASGGPSWREKDSAADVLDGVDEETAARLALVVENYPAEVRKTVGVLGAPFATALLDHENGRPDLALQGLNELPDDVAVVRFERARAAYAMSQTDVTMTELKAFARLHGQHVSMGRMHTGTLLVQCMVESGDTQGALDKLNKLRRRDPSLAPVLHAQLLELTEQYEEADATLVKLLKTYSKDAGLYAMLGRIRVADGRRMAAMMALETGITACECSPGTCGYRPPDIRLFRQLATLYLEDGIEPKRAMELAQQAEALVEQPTWEDAYLAALAAKSSGDPDAPQLALGLRDHTPAGDGPRQEKVAGLLGG